MKFLIFRVFVSLFMINAQTTAWSDAKCSGIKKNDPESGLKVPVLVLSERYRYCDIFGFSFATDSHFCSFPFHFQLLPRLLLTQSAFIQAPSTAHCTSLLC